MAQLISQQRAAFALRHMEQALRHDPEKQRQIRTVANSIPAQIQRTGLGQTLAFALSKKEKSDGYGWIFLYELLQEWLCTSQKIYVGETLMTSLCQGDLKRYQQAQAESLALLVWVRKFARAMLNTNEKD
ncbi:type III-B CRISPR module-associated protein Cmr5 [Aeromonas media]|uniref:CRISPR type III-B/RAMP module-associated protein Cmr5 n=1 Tax=Aeromonas media TaxID=651 RepID=A0AAE6SPK6_AERME|nr:type III-B CRISPR module-associated protein Cmr5 [Aeromonas media]QHQ53575.1 type III-B CRISPR module-associated protein Cmr5 [Aeromonas media]